MLYIPTLMIVHYVTDLFISQSKVTKVQACLIENDGKSLQQPTGDEEEKHYLGNRPTVEMMTSCSYERVEHYNALLKTLKH